MKKHFAFGILMMSAALLMSGYLLGATTAPAPAASPKVEVKVNDDKARREYVNMARVSMGPQAEEIILDLGIMTYEEAPGTGLSLEISTHVYMNVIEAKKLNLMLTQMLERYEQQFGTIETDMNKRKKAP